MKRILPLLALSVVLFAACKKNHSPAPVNNPVWPMKVGNQWIFNNVYYQEGGVVTSKKTATYNASSTSYIRGTQYYSITDGTVQHFYRNANDSTIWNSDDIGNAGIYFREVKLQDTLAEFSQTFKDNNNNVVKGVYRNVGYPTTYSIDGYNCHKCEQTLSDTLGNIYYKVDVYMSHGIGLIRRAFYSIGAHDTLYKTNQVDLLTYFIE